MCIAAEPKEDGNIVGDFKWDALEEDDAKPSPPDVVVAPEDKLAGIEVPPKVCFSPCFYILFTCMSNFKG